MDQKDDKNAQNGESIESKVFKKSLKLDLAEAVDRVIDGIIHPLALEQISLKEREDFTNLLIKTVGDSLLEVIAEVKERSELVIEAFRKQEQDIKYFKKRNNRQVN
ncbi:MAG: hypothetical protein Q8R55_07370 [Candidatus Taylorbacteria bacterium]|nr:hypothetical protein [Candidatus Taylorbacteria bacterium]